jgi:hypothetical protein
MTKPLKVIYVIELIHNPENGHGHGNFKQKTFSSDMIYLIIIFNYFIEKFKK